jgi:hypothetical protein
MTPAAITLGDVQDLGACVEGVEWFTESFPTGYRGTWLELTREWRCSPDWYGWIAAHAPGLSLADRERLANASPRPVHWLRTAAAIAPGLSRSERRSLMERAREAVTRRERMVECERCGRLVDPEQSEHCWYCAGALCGECWEAHGHCGHPEADAENARARAVGSFGG